MRYRDKYDWVTREDADTLLRYREIQSDPNRFKKAQKCIQDTLTDYKEALGKSATPNVPSRKNPATIMRLDNKH